MFLDNQPPPSFPMTLGQAYCDKTPITSLKEQEQFVDSSSYAFVGYDESSGAMPITKYLFSKENLDILQTLISNATAGLDPQGRRIRVPHNIIAGVLSSVLRNGRRTHIGDIYTRYIIPQDHARNDADNLNLQTLNIIVSTIKDEYETIENNKKLSVWNTVYGDFNPQGLRAHPPLRIRRRAPQRMMFNMNY